MWKRDVKTRESVNFFMKKSSDDNNNDSLFISTNNIIYVSWFSDLGCSHCMNPHKEYD